MKTIQWGIIGCGDVTEIKSGPAFNKVNNSKLVAVMRRDAAKAQDYAQRHGVGKWYSDAQQLIDDDEVNAIYVATPPLYHEEYTIKALQAGKPVYVEKPMTINAASAERMLNASAKTGTKLSVAHYRRQQPLFKKIKELVETKTIGDTRLVNLQLTQPPQSNIVAKTEVNWRVDPAIAGGGLFHDLSPHQLDLMLYFFGNPVYASGISLNQAALYNADDIVTGIIRFGNGTVFSGSWCFTTAVEDEKDSCEIIGSAGKITFSIFKHQPIVVSRNGKNEILNFDPLPHVQQPMIEAVVKYFLGEAPNPCSANDGLATMKLIDAFTKKTD